MEINFESKPVYGDHDKYIKTKMFINNNFESKPVYGDHDKYIKTKMFISNNDRFSY